jgi:Uma2 family endonuclease
MAIGTISEELLFTIEDWENFPDDGRRYEIIEGEIHVSTAPKFIHQLLISRIMQYLLDYLKQNPVGEVLPTPGIIFGHKTGVIPDVVYISHERLKLFLIDEKIQGAPELVIEILSPGKKNFERDRKTKLKLYSRYPVEEYWIVNPMRNQIEVFRSTPHGLRPVEVLNEQDNLISPIFPDFALALRDIFRN